MKRLIFSFGLLIQGGAIAAPSLQMHIFDEPDSDEQVSVASKPTIAMHVFDRSEAVQNNAVLPEYKTRSAKEKTGMIAYDRTEVTVQSGYRRDDIDWTIAGPNNWPDPSATVNWRDIEVATVGASGTIYTQDNWLVSLSADYGRVLSGSTQASNFIFFRDELLEFSRSDYEVDHGHTYDISTAVGYENEYLWNSSSYPSARLTPLFGFSYHAQNLQKSSGVQTRSEAVSLPPVGEILENNKNNYKSSWYGPWLGVDSQLLFNQYFKVGFNLAYHYAFYKADSLANSDTRLEDQPKEFKQRARGYGLVGALNGQLLLNRNLSLNLGVNYRHWQAERSGEQRGYTVNNVPTSSIIDEVSWKSFGANIGLNYEF